MTVKLYENEAFTTYSFKNKDEWKDARIKGIGGSDVASIVGLNSWTSNVELYQRKIGAIRSDIAKNELIDYGITMESSIRKAFQLEHKDKYLVQYKKDTLLMNNNNTMLLYSPDGLLYDQETKQKGILEIKTSWNTSKWAKDKIPNNYLCQILHGLNVTGYDFVVLRSRLIYSIKDKNGKDETYIVERDYRYSKDDYIDDMEWLKKEAIQFWNENVMKRIEPNLVIQV